MTDNEKKLMTESTARILDLVNKSGKADYRLELEIGISRNSIQALRSNRSFPKPYILTQLANYFGVSVDYLLGREKQSATAQNASNNATTSPLLARIESLDELQQAKVMAYIDGLQGVNDPIEDAFRHGQKLEKAKQIQPYNLQNKRMTK